MKEMGRELLRYFAWILFVYYVWDVLASVKSYEFFLVSSDYGYSWWQAIQETKIFWHLPFDAWAFYLWWKWK